MIGQDQGVVGSATVATFSPAVALFLLTSCDLQIRGYFIPLVRGPVYLHFKETLSFDSRLYAVSSIARLFRTMTSVSRSCMLDISFAY
jgi:hypothetical protein